MKRFCFYSKSFYTGGMENAVYNMACLMRDRGDEVVIAFRYSNERTERMLEKLATIATEVVCITGNRIVCDILINCDRGDHVVKQIEPLMATIHWFSSCKILNKEMIGSADMIVSQSRWHQNELAKQGIASIVLGNPLDVDRIVDDSQNMIVDFAKPDERVYMIVARISPEKGFERAIQFMKKRLTENSRLFVIGGLTTPANSSIMTRMQMQLGKKVVFLGEKDNPYPYMKRAEYVLCLSDNEIYGLVSEEAHILGVKVVFNRYPTASDQFLKGFDVWFDEPLHLVDPGYYYEDAFSHYKAQNVERMNKWYAMFEEAEEIWMKSQSDL